MIEMMIEMIEMSATVMNEIKMLMITAVILLRIEVPVVVG